MPPAPNAAAPLAWAPDGRWLAHASAGARVVSISRLDLLAPSPERVLPTQLLGHLTLAEPVQSLAVSRDGLWLAVGHPGASASLYAVDLDAVGSWPLVSRAALPRDTAGESDDIDDPDAPTQLAFSPVDDTLVLACGGRVSWLRLDVPALQAALAAARAPAPAAETQTETPADTTADPSAAFARLSVGAESPQRWAFRLQLDPFNWEQQQHLENPPLSPELLRALLGLDTRRVPGPRGQPPRAAQALVALQKELLPPRLLQLLAAGPGAAPLALVADETTQHLPWELLLRDGDDPPLAVQRGLVRLAMHETGPPPVLPEDAEALVIHLDDPERVPADPLAAAMHHHLSLAMGARVTLLRQPTRDGLVKLLGQAAHRLVFIMDRSDTLQPPQRTPGLQITPNGEPLQPQDLLRPLPPELVFLGWPNSSDWAPELLAGGVRAVVTLDWGLDFEGAWAFSDEFTRALAAGLTLMDATLQARQSAYARHPESSAWAAYRVHGDPLYRLQQHLAPRRGADAVDAAAAATTSTAQAIPGEDVVVMTLANGPALVLHPQTAQDLMAADDPTSDDRGQRAGSVASAAATASTASTPAPGFLRKVLQSLNVLRAGSDPADPAAMAQLVRRVDGQSAKGLLALSPSGWPEAPQPVSSTPESAGPPLLVLVHGLLSSGAQTFGPLWSLHPDAVAQLFRQHGDRVYALEHPTLGHDPLDAALQLARVCALGTRLNLLTHSSGGLVAECLVRATQRDSLGNAGLPESSLPHFRRRAAELVTLVRQRRLQVQRVVRVACPARGSLLATGRLDAFLSVLKWTLELSGAVVPAELLDLMRAVAKQRTDPATLPGLAALAPDNPLLQWLYRSGSADKARSELRVVAGDLEGDSMVSWVKTIVADAFYRSDNDLVVQTHSMYGGVPREGGSLFLLDQGSKVSHFNYFRNAFTAQAVVNALLQDQPDGFRTVGPLSWAGESATGLR